MNDVYLCSIRAHFYSISKWKIIVSKVNSVSRFWEFAHLLDTIACVNLIFSFLFGIINSSVLHL